MSKNNKDPKFIVTYSEINRPGEVDKTLDLYIFRGQM